MLRLLLPLAVLVLAASPAAAAEPRASAAAQRHAERALDQAENLRAGQGVRTGRELTDALREVAVGIRHLRGEERERARSLLARPTDAPGTDPDAFPPGAPVANQCLGSFCVHYLQNDLGAAAMAPTVLAEAEKVRAFENGTLGWQSPPSDGILGGDGRVDIYLQELSAQNLFGFAASDPGQDDQSQHSYLVLDNDFDPAEYGGAPALESLRLTLAHEYGHVLQYGYDILADGWHYEASAVWLEYRFDAALDDWLRFLYDGSSGGGWRSLTELPLTSFDAPTDQPRNAKAYGSAVWNHFLTSRYGARGDELQRVAWEVSEGYRFPSTRAYDTAIKRVGGASLASDFAAFAAAVAEWRVPAAGFALPSQLPDVERRGTLAVDGTGVAPRMDHLTFALYDVPDTSAGRIRLAASFPAGTAGAIALVARSGAGAAGPVTTRIAELPTGGAGGVTLDQPDSFTANGGRITAVLVNADASQRGYATSDWAWSRDNQTVAAAITTDVSGPTVTSRSPAPNASGVKPAAQVRVTFSKPVSGVNAQSFSLRAPDGTAVPAAVTYATSSRTATLTPAAPLADTTRYTARLTGAITDASANPLAPTEWSLTTVRQRPQVTLEVVSRSSRAVRVLLRSADRDQLRWSARLVAGQTTVARRSGRVSPGLSRTVRLAARGRRRTRLVVAIVDPQGNSKRIVRTLRLRR